MNRFLLALVLPLLYLSLQATGQRMTVYGTVQDTAQQKGLPFAVVMAVRLSDSVLTSFTRSDTTGRFRIDSLPIDTYQVVVSHPLFSDHTFLVLGSEAEKEINLHNIVLPSKSMQLNEVTVYGYADPVYYKGDTLVYTADSFKVKPNAVVEDLLKRLPGIKVDAQGKIYSQGKAVDQVLVDGDEFFGTDPTVATRNLSAESVESVQVYDKKNDNPSEAKDDDMLKVMDLKLKDDAKKGYFGKVSGASDGKDFYEGELLANHFKGKQKLSVYALGSNTPRTSLNWNDMYEYGLMDDMNFSDDDEGMYYSFGDNNSNTGVPRTFKTGAYFTDMLTRSLKVSLNYNYKKSDLKTASSTASKYFLPDTTYKTTEDLVSEQHNQSHSLGMTLHQQVDSLNELELKASFNKSDMDQSKVMDNAFYTADDTLTRTTYTYNSSAGDNKSSSASLKWTRNFQNRDRKLNAFYSFGFSDRESDGVLRSANHYILPAQADDSLDQQKILSNESKTNFFSITYTEPLSKKFRLEFSGDYSRTDGSQDKKTYDVVNGSISTENAAYSNNFENEAQTKRGGLRLIYEVKKQSFSLGGRLRSSESSNHNLVTDERISQDLLNVLPTATYRYKFSDNKSFMFRYSTDARLPDLNQLQPVPDNSNPNYIQKGNPGLLPSFSHNFLMWMNSYKVVSGSWVYANINFNTTRHAFSNDIVYDSIGRTITTPVNVNGNYSGGMYASGNFPFFSKLIEVNPDLQYSYSHSTNYINGGENVTVVSTPHINLDVSHETDSLEFGLSGGFTYYRASSTLNEQGNERYTSFDYGASVEYQMPWKLRIASDVKYSANRKRSAGYNINTVIWNASIKKTFLSKDNLIVSLEAMDLLNQNVDTRRIVQDNVISDVKAHVVGRYILLKVMFKFNSNKAKRDDEEEE